ncbi:hypothetical protein RFEPED_0381 [Rickettsia felis str. Pedreira]|uniref:Uncharacterized protein n=1 Tax=Rickettsia felis str. Pedreira TaxID=1359196 RepID=A0A0F3MQI5_RICFI|nr:hypothetical protein RFEPED_0381 [Rickettsia felis str. Pedreira]
MINDRPNIDAVARKLFNILDFFLITLNLIVDLLTKTLY